MDTGFVLFTARFEKNLSDAGGGQVFHSNSGATNEHT